MEILAHRGYWLAETEKNTEIAFVRAFTNGYGVETDLRDLGGALVVSHDPPTTGAMPFGEFLSLYLSSGGTGTLALNIKADGLAGAVRSALAARKLDRYFVFDMSVPDTLGYLKAGLRTFTRRSEYEAGSALDGQADGVWFDAFSGGFAPPAEVEALLHAGKSVAVVSPELHGREHRDAWGAWREALAASAAPGRFALCTDFPLDAASYFQDFMSRP